MMMLALYAVFASVASCWQCPHAQAQPLSDRRPLVGHVTRINGSPIGGAEITVRREDEEGAWPFWGGVAITNARGEFSFPDAQEDIYHISIQANGYARDEKTYALTATSPPLHVALARLAPLPLRFLKPDGSPLTNAWVAVRVRGEGAIGKPLYRKRTDATGRLSLLDRDNQPDLTPGSYSIHALAPGLGYAIVDNINVQEDNTKTSEVHLQHGGTLRVTARKAGDGGKDGSPSIGGAMVFLTQALPDDAAVVAPGDWNGPPDSGLYQLYNGGAPLVTRDGDGTVELKDVAPGRYVVRLFLTGNDAPLSQPVEIRARDTATLNFALEPRQSAPLEIIVQNMQGQPVANTELAIQLQPGSGRSPEVIEEAMPPLPPDVPPIVVNLQPLRRASTDSKGKLTLYPVGVGKWRVMLFPPSEERSGGQFVQLGAADVMVTPQGGSVTIRSKPRP